MAKGWGYSSLGNLIPVLLEMKSGCKISLMVPTERVERYMDQSERQISGFGTGCDSEKPTFTLA